MKIKEESTESTQEFQSIGKHLHEKLCTAEKETQSIVATPTFTRCSFKYRRGIS